MRKIFLALILVLAMAFPVYAAGTCVVSSINSTPLSDRIPNPFMTMITLTCTGDSSGNLTSVTIPLSSTTMTNPWNIFGYYLYQVGRTPGTSARAPSASYSVTITDSRGFPIDVALLTSNGSTSPQLTLMANSATGYPVVRSALTVAFSGTGVNGDVVLDLILKSQ